MKKLVISEKQVPSIYDQVKKVNSAVMSMAQGDCGMLGENDATMDDYSVGRIPGDEYDHVCEETSPSSIDLSSFKPQSKLNPDFWKDNKLDSEIRMKLLDIADDFYKKLDISWVKPKDIIMTGSLANYNWSKKYSDIDLHIIVDFKEVDDRKSFVKHYFDSQKNLWNQKHEELSIHGYPVEVYVQDESEPAVQGGIYSIQKDKWVKEPDKEKMSDENLHKDKIKEKVAQYIDRIEEIEQNYKDADGDSYKMRQLSEKATNLFDEIKKMRGDDLNSEKSEMTDGNIIFKALRRLEYLDRLDKMRTLTYDKMNSLDEGVNNASWAAQWANPSRAANVATLTAAGATPTHMAIDMAKDAYQTNPAFRYSTNDILKNISSVSPTASKTVGKIMKPNVALKTKTKNIFIKFFKTTGKRIGKSLAKGIGKGAIVAAIGIVLDYLFMEGGSAAYAATVIKSRIYPSNIYNMVMQIMNKLLQICKLQDIDWMQQDIAQFFQETNRILEQKYGKIPPQPNTLPPSNVLILGQDGKWFWTWEANIENALALKESPVQNTQQVQLDPNYLKLHNMK